MEEIRAYKLRVGDQIVISKESVNEMSLKVIGKKYNRKWWKFWKPRCTYYEFLVQ